ncbi:MAG: UvrD-helicase domain-containing protein [Spirochaetales bacterium]|nr:UvrD-helicase domain-containing protein [Spirochaetales bacterium]
MQPFDWEKAPLDKNILLEASAGTGKTYTLERLVLRLVTEREIPVSRILVVTFTNMAAREMQERIGRLLTAEKGRAQGERADLLRRASGDFDRAAINTIHGFCAQVLQTLPFECGLPPGAEIGGDEESTGRLVQDWFRKNEKNSDPFIKEAYRAAWKKTKGYASLIENIEKIIASEKLNGAYSLIPGEEEEALLKDLCRNWGKEPLSRGAFELGRECKALGSSDELLLALKEDGLGYRLGDKGAAALYEKLMALEHPAGCSDLLEHLNGVGKGFFTQLNQGRNCEHSGSSPFTRAFINWARLLPEIFYEESKSESLIKSLSLLFQFHCAREVIMERNRERLRTGKLSFNDLIDLVHSQLTGPERKDNLLKALRSRYDVLLVDEFQDTDQRQWEMFSALFTGEGKNYFLIGDPKQSIYRFRGADLNVYLKVKDSLPKENRFRLENNYRSHPRLLDGFNHFFGALFGEEGRPGTIGYSPVGAGKPDVPTLRKGDEPEPPIDFLRLEGEPKNREEAVDLWLNSMADHVEGLLAGADYNLDGKPLVPSDMAVLLEGNKECIRFHKLLTDRGIPAVIFNERDIFSSREVSLPLMFLEAMMGKDRGESIKKLLLSPLVGLTAKELVYLEEKGFLDSLVLRFRLYREKTDRGDLIGQFSHFCRLGEEIAANLEEGGGTGRARIGHLGTNFLIRLMKEPGGERLFTNLRHILELLHGEQTAKRLNTGELFRFCRAELSRKHGDETFQVRLDRDGEAVKIMTLHKSKGLQFPLVFFGGGLYPEIINRMAEELTFRKGDENWLDYLKKKENGPRARTEAWEEKKRLYYVGLTRAESKLYMPLYEGWDKGWISWFYHQISGSDTGDLNPFEGSSLKIPEGIGLKACQTLLEKGEGLFRLVPLLEGQGSYGPAGIQSPLVKPVIPSLRLNKRYPSLLSFSSLTQDLAHSETLQDENSQAEADYDRGREEPEEADDTITPENIPGGAGLGNLVHGLFEELDYTLADGSLEAFLTHEGIDLEVKEKSLFYFKADWFRQFGPVVKEMVWNTLNAPLIFPGEVPDLRLRDLPGEQRLHELEFLIRLKDKGSIELNDFRGTISRGYLKGFIDLIFLHEGRYYIADWKTTRCASGDRAPYDEKSVGQIMDDHSYHLQYWIYSAAFYLFMTRNGADFDYDRDFGGVFYFFNRGMTPDHPGRGLFFTRPGREDLTSFLADFTEETYGEV